MIKIVSVVGARPQFVKAAVVSRALRAQDGVREILVHTGQHYDDNMSDVFFRELAIPAPDVNLGVGSDRQGAQTARMLDGLEALMLEHRPDWVLVYGDTNSTIAASLAAAKLRLRVAHVEAGLRSYNRAMPEEINRVVTDHLSDLLFVPTESGVHNLALEGIAGDRVRLVGDVMYDATLFNAQRAEEKSSLLPQLDLLPGGYVLSTVHRAENTDDPARLAAIFGGLRKLSESLPVVLPLHPRTRKMLDSIPGTEATAGLKLIDPLSYLEMTLLEKHARLIATDSGGVQKEAFFHGVPCVTLRDETEWVELVASGWNRLVTPIDAQQVCEALREALATAVPTRREDFYGQGRAGEAIARALAD